MSAELIQMSVQKPAESMDPHDWAKEAQECLESWVRGPWLQLSPVVRLAKLQRAQELVTRLVELEDGRRTVIWGE